MIKSLMKTHLEGFAASSILEVGPGYADFGVTAAQIVGARSITFVDCDDAVLNHQAQSCAQHNLSIKTFNLNLDSAGLSTLEGRYELILCQEVLEHLPHAPEVLAELSKLLAPEGKMIITVPTKRSERWIKRLNPNYMKDEPHGHVREFDEKALRDILEQSSLQLLVLVPTQPHYFISHTWFFGTRMKVEGSTGRVIGQDFRKTVFSKLTRFSKRVFEKSGPLWWGRLIPRNYFVVAARSH